MKEGKDLIDEMRETYGLSFWSSDHLTKFLCERNLNRHITLLDPQKYENCIDLNGTFTIAEIDAILVAQVNDRGHMRAS
jgi:hypothetical protein